MDQLKFDTIQLVTHSKYLLQRNDELFWHKVDIATGEIISVKYNSHQHSDITPYALYIKANYRSQRLTIDFPLKFCSKIILN